MEEMVYSVTTFYRVTDLDAALEHVLAGNGNCDYSNVIPRAENGSYSLADFTAMVREEHGADEWDDMTEEEQAHAVGAHALMDMVGSPAVEAEEWESPGIKGMGASSSELLVDDEIPHWLRRTVGFQSKA